MKPRIAELRISFLVPFSISFVFPVLVITIKRTAADVSDAIVSIVRISSSPRLILKAVGTVDQKKIASPA